MTQPSDNPAIIKQFFRTRAKLGLGLCTILVFGVIFCAYVMPSPFGMWVSVIFLVVEVIYILLDLTQKWPTRWAKSFTNPKNYKHWWVWFVIAIIWFFGYWLFSLNKSTQYVASIYLLVGFLSGYNGIQCLFLRPIISKLHFSFPATSDSGGNVEI